MSYVSEVRTGAPARYRSPLQQRVYETLAALAIPFERVETDEIVTMEDCAAVNERLQMRMVKTLFLCSRKRDAHYLFITAGDKPFRTRAFDRALGVSRVSFAPAEEMEAMLGTRVGAATVLSVLMDEGKRVQVVFDRAVAEEEWYGCSDGTTTGYLKLRTEDVLRVFLPFAGHEPVLAEV